MKKTIEYYVQTIYGVNREKFKNKSEGDIFAKLTGRKTLDSASRELLRDLSEGSIDFKMVFPTGYEQVTTLSEVKNEEVAQPVFS
jgi:hypothetical protein